MPITSLKASRRMSLGEHHSARRGTNQISGHMISTSLGRALHTAQSHGTGPSRAPSHSQMELTALRAPHHDDSTNYFTIASITGTPLPPTCILPSGRISSCALSLPECLERPREQKLLPLLFLCEGLTLPSTTCSHSHHEEQITRVIVRMLERPIQLPRPS